MKTPKLIAIQSVAAVSIGLGLVLPASLAHAQDAPAGGLNRTAEQACIQSAQLKGFTHQKTVSITPKEATGGADVILLLTKEGRLFKLTCGYSPTGTSLGEETAETSNGFWWGWVLLPLIGLPLLLWWARGRDAKVAANRTYVGRSETIVRSNGSSVSIYADPRMDSNVTGTLRDEQRVTLSGYYEGNWAELADGGWIPTQYLETSPRYINR